MQTIEPYSVKARLDHLSKHDSMGRAAYARGVSGRRPPLTPGVSGMLHCLYEGYISCLLCGFLAQSKTVP